MGSSPKDDAEGNGYVKYDPCDVTFFGAEKVIREERKHIFKRQKLEDNQDQEKYIRESLAGLALSGGGIRSASFSLGVLQALSYRNVLKKVDYLSTVSGGGYIGSSLTWLLSQPWTDKKGNSVDLGVDRERFPYGTYPMIGQDSKSKVAVKNYEDEAKKLMHRGALLRYLRQHGKYLTPGHGITGLSLLGVVLRGSILSIFIYFSLLILLMTGLESLGAFKSFYDVDYSPMFSFLYQAPNFSILYGLAGLSLFIIGVPLYSLSAYLLSRRKSKRKPGSSSQSRWESLSYQLRRSCEILYSYLLLIVALLVIVGLIPVIYKMMVTDSGSSFWAAITGAVSTGIGFISSISAYIKTGSNKKGFIPVSLLVLVGTIALWFGLLLLAYHCSLQICGSPPVIIGLAIAVFVVGWFANLNYVSVHRYYRDRLMETFMPDVPEVLDPGKTPERASPKADKGRLSTMCGYAGADKFMDMPYHIINTNLVLVSSKIAKFKGRGGDNFILTPAYCGSNATGWQQTGNFMDDRMTLPTAMAISGAAVNPSTGVGGDGMTRQPFLSMLMGFLNIRLGYWAPHPNRKYRSILTSIPNFFVPGFFEMFFRSMLREDSRFLQLTDGGHFENLGIYELVRRKARVIIACDGAADPDYEFTDLANALEKIRADFGVLIEISTDQLEAIVPRKTDLLDKSEYATQGFIVADILYPDRDPGVFVYIKSTFFNDLSADLFGYKQTHKEFPDEPTSDQFFDEKQFEAYRELGYQTAWTMMKHADVKGNTVLNDFFKG